MNAVPLICLALVAALSQQTRMDSSIGGASVDKYHPSVYDARQKLYLFSGGD